MIFGYFFQSPSSQERCCHCATLLHRCFHLPIPVSRTRDEGHRTTPLRICPLQDINSLSKCRDSHRWNTRKPHDCCANRSPSYPHSSPRPTTSISRNRVSCLCANYRCIHRQAILSAAKFCHITVVCRAKHTSAASGINTFTGAVVYIPHLFNFMSSTTTNCGDVPLAKICYKVPNKHVFVCIFASPFSLTHVVLPHPVIDVALYLF